MDMRAVAGRLGAGEASVRAVEAGADVILMPPSVPGALKAILDAVCEGRIPEERIDDAVLRLLEAKESLGLHEERTVDLIEIPRTVGTPAHTQVADEIAEKSLVLLRNGNNLLPLLGTSTARVLSVNYRRTSDVLAGRYFNRRLRQTYPRLATVDVDRSSLSQLSDEVLARARRSALVVVSTYVTAVSYSGSVALPEEVSEFVQALGDLGIPHMVISFGNPYLITEFPEVQAYLLAWSGAEASQRAAARAILGELEIQGRTPTRIPGFAEIGDGIRLPRKEALTGG
jgi:beta-N-acetylhexosaminidase